MTGEIIIKGVDVDGKTGIRCQCNARNVTVADRMAILNVILRSVGFDIDKDDEWLGEFAAIMALSKINRILGNETMVCVEGRMPNDADED